MTRSSQAMLAHGGEDSDDSGEVSGSISSDGDEGDEDSEVTPAWLGRQ